MRILGVTYDRGAVVLVNAIKEQRTQIEDSQTLIQSQQNLLETEQRQINHEQRQIDRLRKLVRSMNTSANLCEEQSKSVGEPIRFHQKELEIRIDQTVKRVQTRTSRGRKQPKSS